MDALYQSEIRSLPLLHRGKVRDIYEVDEERMLIVTTDRISAFDVVLPDPIPGKGMVLDAISRFWFERTRELVANHLLDVPLEEILPDPSERVGLDGRSTVARRLDPQPVEAVVRGYLIGSGWKDYQRTGGVCGIDLPDGLLLADQLPEPIYTPATKAELGEHDENISFGETVSMLGEDKAVAIRDAALEIYAYASAYALARGIIIADTKFEFGLDADGGLVLMDEVLTPDSSRFWPREDYQPGKSPLSFDKQFVRDYLETLDWDKTDPGPELPAEIVEKTAEKYREVYRILTGRELPA